jgi:hypothetical protein
MTSTGVGTAIPAREAGEISNDTTPSSIATHTITLPLSSIPASTSNTPDATSHMSIPTGASAAESMLGGLLRDFCSLPYSSRSCEIGSGLFHSV